MEATKPGSPAPIKLEAGLYGFRMNVDDIDAAYAELREKGCTVVKEPFDTGVGRNMMIKDAGGIAITLIQHIKK